MVFFICTLIVCTISAEVNTFLENNNMILNVYYLYIFQTIYLHMLILFTIFMPNLIFLCAYNSLAT